MPRIQRYIKTVFELMPEEHEKYKAQAAANRLDVHEKMVASGIQEGSGILWHPLRTL